MGSGRIVSSCFVAIGVALFALTMVAGCSREDSRPREPAAAPQEATFAQQAAAVRAGESDQIRLDHATVGDDDLVELAGLEEKLRRLNLSHTTITNAGLARIAAIGSLAQLRLRSEAISDDGLAELTKLTELRHLHLIDAPIGDAGLAHLEKLTGLRSLYLDGTRDTDAGMSRLMEALPEVHLHFDGGHHHHDTHADDHDDAGEKPAASAEE